MVGFLPFQASDPTTGSSPTALPTRGTTGWPIPGNPATSTPATKNPAWFTGGLQAELLDLESRQSTFAYDGDTPQLYNIMSQLFLTAGVGGSLYISYGAAASLYLTNASATSTYETISSATASLALKANIASPAFTGVPTTPAPTAYNNQIANASWVGAVLGGYGTISWVETNFAQLSSLDTLIANYAISGGGNYTSNGFGICITFPGWVTNSSPIMIQIGSSAFYGASGSSNTVHLPTAFLHSFIMVTGNIGWNNSGNQIGMQINGTLSTFTAGFGSWNGSSATGDAFSWIAIGY